MINQDKWINSIPKTVIKSNEEANQVDNYRWINTISKKDTYNNVANYNNFGWKYSLLVVLFVCGLLFVSAIKNKTRSLEKEINNLKASNNVIKFNLDQAILDNEVITSPDNISLLAKEYLNIDLVSYKKSQIKKLSDENEKFTKVNKIKKEKINKKKIKNFSDSITTQVAKRIEIKKTEITKLKELYYNPTSIPKEIKTQVAIQIDEKKNEIRNIYSAPKDIFSLERATRWGVIQVVKLFLGMPIIPGR